MATWGELVSAAPELAQAGRRLLYQHGVGLAYLATVGADGGPRVHPVCPLLDDTGLYLFVIPSPKLRDLVRDGRYAMHTFPCEDDESGLFLAGQARQVVDPALRAALGEQFVAERS
jgi:Pyridoxamine 5'-phosphate oxidase